eukprot:CAMPEP_0176435106 /NCGR_PEP_ID=MMETSP0127-20121128/17103_1 /TAXON_ID=938130 /ORGANISM="Platyophrya macrostoma, Strain WH" /LENGTH=339 /DNA_ID=CAMNT_0017818027 /DNA_START=930 /DNA_END=1949 /DNA_ORIENTATION=+
MQVRVREVVLEQHLQEHVAADISKARTLRVIAVVERVQRNSLLEHLHEHVARRDARRGRGEHDAVKVAEVVPELQQVVTLALQVQLALDQRRELAQGALPVKVHGPGHNRLHRVDHHAHRSDVRRDLLADVRVQHLHRNRRPRRDPVDVVAQDPAVHLRDAPAVQRHRLDRRQVPQHVAVAQCGLRRRPRVRRRVVEQLRERVAQVRREYVRPRREPLPELDVRRSHRHQHVVECLVRECQGAQAHVRQEEVPAHGNHAEAQEPQSEDGVQLEHEWMVLVLLLNDGAVTRSEYRCPPDRRLQGRRCGGVLLWDPAIAVVVSSCAQRRAHQRGAEHLSAC